jgi:hypothetical protein
MNDIKTLQHCPLTNQKLKYSPQVKGYKNSVKYAQSNKIIKNKFDFKSKNISIFEDIKKIFNDGEFNLIKKEGCVKIFKELYTTKSFRLSLMDLLSHKDFVCSVFHHTSKIPIEKLNISERCFCIENGITSRPTDENGDYLKFINRFEGYSKHSSKAHMYASAIKKAEFEISEKFKIVDYIKDNNSGTTSRINVICKKCEYEFTPFFKNALWKKIYCPKCNGFSNRSHAEDEIHSFITSLGITKIVKNTKEILPNLELDLYIPDLQIGIEYNGILWHSFGISYPNNAEKESLLKNRASDKHKLCKERDIKLITIYENEWMLKKDIVKSILMNKLGKTPTRIYARKCTYGDVDKKIASTFLEKNHIQGDCKFSNAYGLYYNNELVSLMCFGQRKITRGSSKYELIRFCNKINTQVVGGASKILCNSNIDNFISYCDLRYSSGELYKKLGMRLINQSKPNYFYTYDKINLLNRMNFQKHTLIKDETDNFKTERVIMYERGYRRIYDCGNLVFEYKKP